MKVLRIVLVVLGVLVVAFGGFIGYLQLNWTRILDGITVENTGAASNNPKVAKSLKAGETYTALTYNIGFGAYTPDYTFFMDTGVMKDGTEMRGEHSTAVSEESVRACTDGALQTAKTVASGSPADFMLFQEVDEDSTRSYHVNQRAALTDAFPTCEAFYAENFHSGFLPYPLHDPHGRVRAGLLTLSDASAEATRRSYPIDESFPWRFFDLDRCFCALRIPVENGRELVLINNHMSAYDKGGTYRAQQLKLLCGVMADELSAGNYVIVGGDWNHALCDSENLYESDQLVPEWVSTFDEHDLPDGFSVVRASNLDNVASCRGDDIPYELGHTYRVTVDGFVVSSNVRATASNIDTEFTYSDHNPVLLSFELVG